jgi:two-component system, NtrC family, sensor histidine kinase HydH
MKKHTPNVLRAALFAFLCLVSVSIIVTTTGNMKTIRVLAWRSLENSALAISSAAESALVMKDMVPGEEFSSILSDRVVAYAFIADSGGKILFHTNGALKGSFMKGFLPEDPDKPSGRKIVMGTGIGAYEYVFPLKTSSSENSYLVLVMNTAETENIISNAGRIWWTAGVVIILLWISGILFERMASRYIRMENDMQRQRELGMIGQMTSVLAHEIRNALGGLKGYAQWVDEKTGSSDERKKALGFIIEGSDRIGSLVNEMLLFSRDETYRIEKINLYGLVSVGVTEALSSFSGSRNIAIDDDIYVTADAEKLKRGFLNGLINAKEAISDKGEISVCANVSGGEVEIRIEDNGEGLGEEELGKVFTPFFTTKTNGTGLGLAYAQKVIRGMGGRIYLRNRSGAKGAVLVIQIPGGKGE